VNLGSLLDAVPHTREAKVTGGSNRGQFNRSLERLGVQGSDYTGPTGIASAVMEQSTKVGLLFLSLWGHAPHYLQATPNYMVSYSLLMHLKRVLGLDLDLAELEAQARTFVSEVDKVTSRDPQIQAYVQRLEQQYDETLRTLKPLPPPEEVVKELEEFLKESRGDEQEGPKQD
jgi:proteasome assembly chaperone (PAC2) family protein